MTQIHAKRRAPGRAAHREETVPAIGEIDGWNLDSIVAEGPFTDVYRARPAGCGADRPADYAVKLLRQDVEGDAAVLESIFREAYIGRHVSHEHLVPVLDYSINSSPYFVVMPLLTGVTLESLLKTGPRLSAPSALWIARQTAQALGALHRAGWLHGDIKPSNLFVSPQMHVTLLDLGFARPFDAPGNIVDRPLMGTLHYVAPELITSTVRADQRSDIYSLGAVLYEMLTGRRPFESESATGLAAAHLQEKPPNPRQFRPQLSRGISDLVLRMLAKEPLRRPQNAEELISQLTAMEIESFDHREVATQAIPHGEFAA